MSQMSEMSSMAQEPPAGGKEIDKKFVGTVVILLLLIGALAFIYLSGSSSEANVDGGSGGEDDSSGTSQGPSGTPGHFVTKATSTPSTRSTPRRRTVFVVTTSPTPDIIQETPYPARPVPKKREPYEDLLLCTVSHRAIFKEMYPPDGHCDLLFYTTAYYEPTSNQFRGARDEFSFSVFLSKARSAGANSKTGYGVSFDYVYSSVIDDQLRQSTAQDKFKALWNNNIYHYGMLHVYDKPDNITSTDKLRLLKTIKARQDALGANKNGHRVLGFRFVGGYKNPDKYRQVLNYTQRNYPVTIIVTVGHMFKASYGGKINGPQIWYSGTYYALYDIASYWKLVKMDDNVRIMPSFTMSAAAWIFNGSSGNLDDLQNYRINWWNPVIYVQSCKDTYSQSGYHSDGELMFKGNKSLGFVLTYDTAENLKKKMEKFFGVVTNLPKKHGWALYDVDLDDFSNECSKGAFHRLKEISRYMHL